MLFELLDFEAGLEGAPGTAARFFFNDLAQANGASATAEVRACGLGRTEVPRCGGDSSLHGLLVGVQRVAKRRTPDYKDGPQGDHVLIHLASLRFPERGMDLLVSLNTAFEPRGGGSGAGVLAETVPEEVLSSAEALFRNVLASFEVRDWSLLLGS